MQNIIIDEEFKSLLPALDKETYASLEENLIASGCRDALVLWDNILIDGHNRYGICTKHKIPFNTVSKEFDTREAALIWIIKTQVSRRNLTPIQLSHYRGLHYRADKKITKNESGKNQYSEPVEVSGQNDHKPKMPRTEKRLSEQYNVSPKTIRRDAKVADAINAIGETSPEAKRMILKKKKKIDKKELEELLTRPKEEISAIAIQIEEGTYEKKKAASPAPETPGNPVDLFLAGMRPLETAIGKISNGIDTELPRIKKKADVTQLKTALRAYIDRLEELYSRM